MGRNPLVAIARLSFWQKIVPWLLLVGGPGFVRWSKGALLSDAYALLSRPFWPGSAQKEWIQKGANIEQQARLSLLEQDNLRLREILRLEKSSGRLFVSAAVISRISRGWWQQHPYCRSARAACGRRCCRPS